jgi:cytochrome c-type biogenesis protein CcmF
MVTGHLAVSKNGKPLGMMYPARWFFRKHEQEPTTEVAIRRTPIEDLYLVMPAFDLQNQSATLEIVVNPLVNWIWAGFGIMAIGTGIALLPESTFAFAAAKVPAGAATTGVVLLIALLLAPATIRAQHVESASSVPVTPRTAVERELQNNIICMCGTCGRKRVAECTCALAAQMREEISGLVKHGMTTDQVYQYYIAKYGSQEPLAAPLDQGFNRLAWLFPYVVGIAGACMAAIVAVRSSHRGKDLSAAPSRTYTTPELSDRLDDELRSLD